MAYSNRSIPVLIVAQRRVEFGSMIKINYVPLVWVILLFSIPCLSSLADENDVTDPYRHIRGDEIEYDDSQDKPWQEELLKELVPPEDDNLVELDIDHPPIGFKIFIDKTSINVSERDSVVRYWLVFKAGKSRNAMFEGMKCNSSEYKTYAYENKWKKGRINIDKNAAWQPIRPHGHNQFHYELEKYFFCSGVLPRPVEDILDIIAGYKSTTTDHDPTYHYAQ